MPGDESGQPSTRLRLVIISPSPRWGEGLGGEGADFLLTPNSSPTALPNGERGEEQATPLQWGGEGEEN